MTYSDDDHIDYIIDRFDFEIVRGYMVKTDWRWVGSVPTLSELKSTALSLLMQVKDGEVGGFIEMGGFVAIKCSDYLKLDFSISYKESIYLNLTDNYNRDKKQKDRKDKLNALDDILS